MGSHRLEYTHCGLYLWSGGRYSKRRPNGQMGAVSIRHPFRVLDVEGALGKEMVFVVSHTDK